MHEKILEYHRSWLCSDIKMLIHMLLLHTSTINCVSCHFKISCIYKLLLSLLFTSHFRTTGAVDQSEPSCVRKLPPTLSRHPSLTVNYAEPRASLEDDTFEHILQETAYHDTVMAFYYRDENNKVWHLSCVQVKAPIFFSDSSLNKLYWHTDLWHSYGYIPIDETKNLLKV
jgi:hypothetical protein